MNPLHNDTVRGIAAILIAAHFMPMTIWAANRAEIGFPDGLILWTLLVSGFGILVWWVLQRVGLETKGATAVAFILVLGFSSLGIRSQGTPGGTLTLSVLLLVVCALVYRLRRIRAMQWFQSWVVLFVALSPAIFALNTYLTGAAQVSAAPVHIPEGDFGDHPDVVLLVLDAHTSLDVLEEQFDVDVTARYAPWRAHDGLVKTGMRANYALTHLSLASIFEMRYPYEDDARIREADWDHLLAKVSGENTLVDVFKSQGYRYTVVESGWAGLHCTGFVD